MTVLVLSRAVSVVVFEVVSHLLSEAAMKVVSGTSALADNIS